MGIDSERDTREDRKLSKEQVQLNVKENQGRKNIQ